MSIWEELESLRRGMGGIASLPSLEDARSRINAMMPEPGADRSVWETLETLLHGSNVVPTMPTLEEAQYRINALRQGDPVSGRGQGMGLLTPTPEDYLSASLDAVTPLPVGLGTIEDAIRKFPGFRENFAPYLTESEKALFETPGWKSLAAGTQEQYGKLPPVPEAVTMAQLGGAKRGWYSDSHQAINQLFANARAPDDPERFTALLAALSPQTSVQSNLKNAINTWVNWDAAGRPTDPQAILEVMGRSVEGEKGTESVLGAWRNNAYRALTAPDARDMLGEVGLSGPKVQSFFQNLSGIYDEVTNDAWMSKLSSVDQALFGGKTRTAKNTPFQDRYGKIGIKGPGYLAQNVLSRRAAEELGWNPAEFQETGWSFGKTLQELGYKPATTVKGMEEFGVAVPEAYRGLAPSSAESVLRRGLLTDEAIGAVPAFGDLVKAEPYASALRAGGYDPGGLLSPVRPPYSSPYERIGTAPGELELTPQGQHALRLARRLDAATQRKSALTAVDEAQQALSLAQTPAETKKAESLMRKALEGLKRTARDLPYMTFEKKYRDLL